MPQTLNDQKIHSKTNAIFKPILNVECCSNYLTRYDQIGHKAVKESKLMIFQIAQRRET